jgi:hypothetical protein
MNYDYDRRYEGTSPARNEKLAMNDGAKLLNREWIGDSGVCVKTYESYGGPRKTHAVRRFFVVEWGSGRRNERSTSYTLKRDAMAFAQEKATSLQVVYAVGDLIDGFGRAMGKTTTMRALVQDRKADVQNGKPGWVGVLVSSRDQKQPPGTAAWGYDVDITERVGRAPAGLEQSLVGR